MILKFSLSHHLFVSSIVEKNIRQLQKMQSIQFVSMLQFVSTLLSDPKTFYSSSLFMVRFIKKIIINSFFMVTNN